MTSLGGLHHVTRVLWRKRKPTPIQCLVYYYHERHCSNQLSNGNRPFSTAAAFESKIHTHRNVSRSNAATTTSTTTTSPPRSTLQRHPQNIEFTRKKREHSTELTRLLTGVKASKATEKDLKVIWREFERDQTGYLHPPLVTKLHRLVAILGNFDTMKRLQEILDRRGMLRRPEDMDWVVLSYIKMNKVQGALSILNNMYKHGQTPGSISYENIFKWLAKHFDDDRHHQLAINILEEMTRRRIHITRQMYYQLLVGEILHRSDKVHLLDWIKRLLAREFESKHPRAAMRMKRFVKLMEGRAHPAIEDVMIAVMDTRLQLDIDTWNAAIHGCARAGNMEAAQRLLTLVRKQIHLSPNLYTFLPLIRGYLCQLPSIHFQHATTTTQHQFRLDAATHVFRDMIESGITPNVDVYGAFLKAYTRDEATDDDTLRLQTIKQLIEASLSSEERMPDTFMVPLFEYFIEKRKLSEAEDVYYILRNYGHEFSRRFLGCIYELIATMASRRLLISAITLTYDLLGMGHWPSSHAICEVIWACGRRRDIEAGELLISAMEAIQKENPALKLHASCYVSLIREYALVQDKEGAMQTYQKVLSMGSASTELIQQAQHYLTQIH